MAKRKNPADATLRNVRAAHRREVDILKRVRRLELALAALSQLVDKIRARVQ